MKRTTLLLLALATAAAPVLTHAQQDPNGMTYEQFQALDKDGNGTISEAEYFVFMDDAFRKLDTNGNNTLSPEETAHVMSAEQFSQVDANGDGRITRQEFLEHVMKDFHRSDNNGDAQLHP